MGSYPTASWQPGGYSFLTVIHEVGHALGLKHPFDDSPRLPTATDTLQYSVMSYTDHASGIFRDVIPNGSGGYSFHTDYIQPKTPMLYDIAAIQYLYGANTGYRTGNDTYTFDPTTPFFQTLWDAGGTDTISVFNFATDSILDLRAGSFSSLGIPSDALPPGYSGGTTPTYYGANNLAIAFGCVIENATGGQGNDTLDGGAGSDTARLEGAFASYSISYNSSARQFTISGLASGTDTYVDVELFQFSDQLRTASSLITVDTTAPTVLNFSPADEATGVAVGANIVLTFSEAIARGTGSIVLKTAAGAVVATYDATSSSNLSVAGSVFTLNPTVDLTAGTTYGLEFAAGSVKDLAGNPFAGTTGYNFTTASSVVTPPGPLGAMDDFFVLQPSTPSVAGAGVGNDVYLLSGSMVAAGKQITISDTFGSNTLQFAPGLSVASSQVAATAVKLNLTNGASVTVLGADKFGYDLGGNLSAGLNPADLSYGQFVQNFLGTSIPTSGVNNGGALGVVGGGAAASVRALSASGDDFLVLQAASPAVVGAGVGNDTYLIPSGLLAANNQITISDTFGANSLQLVRGLQVTSAQIAATAIKLNFAGGASVTVLGADQFTYEAGSNTTAGVNQSDLSYSQFVQTVLGGTVPLVGVVNAPASVI